ncbi:MAG TPA: tRNA 2-thiouridine(34) synthase MnmA [Desulfobacterales bacterium]
MSASIAVAVSGGIDSLMAARLLKEQGHPVFGIHFRTRYTGLADIARIGTLIGMPVHTVDLSREFDKAVVDYFAATYRAGKTPNPCLVCNPAIKFGVLLAHARRLGAGALATGHYARIAISDSTCRLLQGRDAAKDQSYFLAFLRPDQLRQARFPLGELRKTDVQRMARDSGLQPLAASESQDVCFVRGGHYEEFLMQTVGFRPQSGDIVDPHGRVLGRHPGLHRFTVGQRRGINCPAAEPYYVLRLEPSANRLVVGHKTDTYSRDCRVENIHWITEPSAASMNVHTRIRYRHRAAESAVTLENAHAATVRFRQAQSAVTPGQGAVFYRGEEVLGGGFIV